MHQIDENEKLTILIVLVHCFEATIQKQTNHKLMKVRVMVQKSLFSNWFENI